MKVNSVNSAINTPQSLAFFFVCQRGNLAPQSLLLVASLRKYFNRDCELIAAVPEGMEPAECVMDFHREMGVRIETIQNPYNVENRVERIANKIFCLRIPTAKDRLIFIDTDMLCTKSFGEHHRFSGDISLKPADACRVFNWEEIYAETNVPMPTKRITTSVSRAEVPPYYNSGFMAIAPDLAPKLADLWQELFEKYYNGDSVHQHSNSNQIFLSIALQKLNLSVEHLGMEYNYPLNGDWSAHHLPLTAKPLPFFCHYHGPRFLLQKEAEPVLKEVEMHCADYPFIAERLAKNTHFAKLLP